jgi:rubrerythrin
LLNFLRPRPATRAEIRRSAKNRKVYSYSTTTTDAPLNTIFPAVDILNFALSLEHLENAYYHERLALYSPEEFIAAGYPTSVRGRFEQIALHEKTHVELLSSAISAAGGKATKPCEYKL